jgi:hypothetical protein
MRCEYCRHVCSFQVETFTHQRVAAHHTAHPRLFGVVSCCAVQGTLRDQLDRRQLPRLPNSSLLHPAVAVALSHDIAAALMHLHKEGIV